MEDWEKEIEDIVYDIVHCDENDCDSAKKNVIRLKNYFQKERVIAKIKENNNWIEFFSLEQFKEIEPDQLTNCFRAMNMKYEALLTRFPC